MTLWRVMACKPWLRNTVFAVFLGVPLLTMLAGWVLTGLVMVALQKPVALGTATLTLRDVEHGLFSSRLHYTLAWPLGNGEHVAIALQQRLDPGPLPMRALEDGDWRPALLVSELQSTRATLGPQDAPRPLPLQLQLTLRASLAGALSVQGQAHAPDLPFGAVSVQAQQVHLNLEHAWWNQHVQTQFQARQLGLRQGGEESVRLEGVQHRLSGTLGARSQLKSDATVQQLSLWGQNLAGLTHAFNMHDVDTAALSRGMGGDTTAWPQAFAPGASLDGALLSVQHPQSTTQVRLQTNTQAHALTIDVALPKTALLKALQATPRLTQLSTEDARLAQQQAEMVFAFISGQMLASGWFQSNEEGLHSALTFGPTGTVVNGEALSWEAFQQRFFPNRR